jgi:alkylation response protein AidB-like acyl-CoA dehydrogenase
MDWRETEDQAAFRAEVRAVIEAKLPQRYKDAAARGGPGERAWEFDRKAPEADRREAAVAWHAALNERGWVAPHWPSEYGGAGLSSVEQFVLN